jgi:hypothetical protein
MSSNVAQLIRNALFSSDNAARTEAENQLLSLSNSQPGQFLLETT